MSFVSLAFLVLLAVTLLSYHLASGRVTTQNLILLCASTFFYGWWSGPFLALIVAESLLCYVSGQFLQSCPSDTVRRISVGLTSFLLLAVLCYFKYLGFFVDSARHLLGIFGVKTPPITLEIILPLAISFHTFQLLSYVVDVYRGEKAERNILTFLVFSSFFPQLIAGPIERARHLLPQFAAPRRVTGRMVGEAVWLLVYGYFVKVVIADGMAPIVGSAFTPTQSLGWWTILGTLAFSIQIYADFLGYSLIAKGVAQLFGIELVWNFNYPYWSASISEFWRRWHISLGRWLRDYLYIPLGGNRGGSVRTFVNLMVTMLLGGLWHGAEWTFVAWGGLHGLALASHRGLRRIDLPAIWPVRALGHVSTLLVVMAGWFLFRAKSWTEVSAMVRALGHMEWVPAHSSASIALLTAIAILGGMEIWQKKGRAPYVALALSPWGQGVLMGVMLVATIAMVGRRQPTFIYFQF